MSKFPGATGGAWLRLAATATAASVARALVQQEFRTWGLQHLIDAGALIVSELVTNAVNATGVTDPHPSYEALGGLATILVHLRTDGKRVLLEVWDTSTERPKPVQADADQETGRGLQIVAALSVQSGSFLVDDGKVVYAELAVVDAPGGQAADTVAEPPPPLPRRKEAAHARAVRTPVQATQHGVSPLHMAALSGVG